MWLFATFVDPEHLPAPARGRLELHRPLSLIVAGYGNAIASIPGGSFGVRGLALDGPIVNSIVYLLFGIAVLAGIGLLARGGAPAIRGGTG